MSFLFVQSPGFPNTFLFRMTSQLSVSWENCLVHVRLRLFIAANREVNFSTVCVHVLFFYFVITVINNSIPASSQWVLVLLNQQKVQSRLKSAKIQTLGLHSSTKKACFRKKFHLNCDQLVSNGTAKQKLPTQDPVWWPRGCQPRTVTSNRVPCVRLSAVSYCW